LLRLKLQYGKINVHAKIVINNQRNFYIKFHIKVMVWQWNSQPAEATSSFTVCAAYRYFTGYKRPKAGHAQNI